MTITQDWPEYCYVAKADTGYLACVQNVHGETSEREFADFRSAMHFAQTERKALGVTVTLSYFAGADS